MTFLICRKRIITARAKEVQYQKGVQAITAYSETHGNLLNNDKKESKLVLQCQHLPASAARMRVLKLFNDVNTTYRYKNFEELKFVIRATQEQPFILKLLKEDLYPPIRYNTDVVVSFFI